MAKKKGVHVVKSEGQWAVKREGAGRASSVHKTQETAWKAGRRIAKRERSEAFLHGRDGRIQERNTYSRDPHPPKG